VAARAVSSLRPARDVCRENGREISAKTRCASATGKALVFVAAVREKPESKSRPDSGIVRRQCRLANGKDETLLEYFATLLAARRATQ
jgi:hypothetical protein